MDGGGTPKAIAGSGAEQRAYLVKCHTLHSIDQENHLM